MADMMLTYWTGGFCRAINTTYNGIGSRQWQNDRQACVVITVSWLQPAHLTYLCL